VYCLHKYKSVKYTVLMLLNISATNRRRLYEAKVRVDDTCSVLCNSQPWTVYWIPLMHN